MISVNPHAKDMQALYTFGSVDNIVMSLVHNAIDASATRIQIDIDFENLNLSVKDNGAGFISLEHIGEVPVSSRVSLYGKSGQGADITSKIEIHTKICGDLEPLKKIISCGSCSISPTNVVSAGSSIKAFGLFFQYPRRRSYVDQSKSNSVITKCIKILAILHPQITFILNSKAIMSASNSSRESFFQVFHIAPAPCVPIRFSKNQIEITGFYMNNSSSGPDRQLFFVNQILLTDQFLKSAMANIIREKSFHALVKICIPGPYTNESLARLLSEAMPSTEQVRKPVFESNITLSAAKSNLPSKYLAPVCGQKGLEWKNPVFKHWMNAPLDKISKKNDGRPLIELTLPKSDLNHLQILGQVDAKFIVVKSEKTLFLLDQHAADERVKLETFLKEYETETGNFGIFSIPPSSRLKEGLSRHRVRFDGIGIIYSPDSVSVSFRRNFRHPDTVKLIENCILWFDERKDDAAHFTIPCPVLDHFKSKGKHLF